MAKGRVNKKRWKWFAPLAILLLLLLAIGLAQFDERPAPVARTSPPPSSPPAPFPQHSPSPILSAAPAPQNPTQSEAAPPPSAPLEEPRLAKPGRYIWTFDDIYQVFRDEAVPRKPNPEIARPMDAACPGTGSIFAQRSWEPTFAKSKTKKVECVAGRARFPSFLLGSNYWRFSKDGTHWERSVRMDVFPRFIPTKPKVMARFGNRSGLRLSISREQQFVAWVVETSARPDFAPFATRATVVWPKQARIAVPKVGGSWIRARGIAAGGGLSEWSDSSRIGLGSFGGGAPAIRLSKKTSVPEAAPRTPAQMSAPAQTMAAARCPEPESVEAPACVPAALPESSLSAAPCRGLDCLNLKDRRAVGLRGSIAAGLNYVRIDENLTEATASYGDIRGPSLAAELAASITDRFSFEANFKNTPFQFNNDSINSGKLSGSWQTYGAQAAIKSFDAASQIDREVVGFGASQLEFLAGVQVHEIPIGLFLADRTPVIRNVQMSDVSVGARWRFNVDDRTRTTTHARVQQPLQTSASESAAQFKPSSVLAFDGSIGMDRRMSELGWLGVHWYGQLHRFNFEYADSTVNTAGTQSTFFSTVELRMSIEY